MRKFLENTNTFLAALIGTLGGFFWAKSTGWNDWEPLLLFVPSLISIIFFILLRVIPDINERPIVELELTGMGSSRSSPSPVAGITPQTETEYGTAFIMERGYSYRFDIERRFTLVIRNNSNNNAYNLMLYKPADTDSVRFVGNYSSLEPITILKPLELDIVYKVQRVMTHDEADVILQSDLPEDLKNFVLIAEYKNETRRKYYTKFWPRTTNEHSKKKPDLSNYVSVR